MQSNNLVVIGHWSLVIGHWPLVIGLFDYRRLYLRGNTND